MGGGSQPKRITCRIVVEGGRGRSGPGGDPPPTSHLGCTSWGMQGGERGLIRCSFFFWGGGIYGFRLNGVYIQAWLTAAPDEWLCYVGQCWLGCVVWVCCCMWTRVFKRNTHIHIYTHIPIHTHTYTYTHILKNTQTYLNINTHTTSPTYCTNGQALYHTYGSFSLAP